jgi:mono/diheme cytochrome c family protein
MRRTFGLSLLAVAVAFGLTVRANEKPTAEYQDIMKSNAATNGAMGLRAHITAKDYDAIAKDAATFKANFTKIEAFWTQKKVDDAIKFARTAHDAAEDLEKAAKAKDDAAILAAQMKLTPNCAGCHMAHREQLPDKTFEIKP